MSWKRRAVFPEQTDRPKTANWAMSSLEDANLRRWCAYLKCSARSATILP